MTTEASAWLLERYDNGEARQTNWPRPLFELLPDGASEDDTAFCPAMASWPKPFYTDDLGFA